MREKPASTAERSAVEERSHPSEAPRPTFRDVDENTEFELELPSGVAAYGKASRFDAENRLRVEAERGWYQLEPMRTGYSPSLGDPSVRGVRSTGGPLKRRARFHSRAWVETRHVSDHSVHVSSLFIAIFCATGSAPGRGDSRHVEARSATSAQRHLDARPEG